MKIDRRRFVTLTGAQVGTVIAGASLIGCSQQPSSPSPAGGGAAGGSAAAKKGKAGAHGHAAAGTKTMGEPHHATIAFIGLCAHVTNDKDPAKIKKMHVGLVKPGSKYNLPPHVPTLEVPRSAVRSISGWKVMALSDKCAYFSLEGQVLTLDYKPEKSTDSGLKVGYKTLPNYGTEDLCPEDQDRWQNLAWVLDLREMHPDGKEATLVADWQSKLDATVKLDQGFVETTDIPALEEEQYIWAWEVGAEGSKMRRALKETVLYATFKTRLVTLKATTRTIELDLESDDIVIRITQLPVNLPSDKLIDLRAYYDLVQEENRPPGDEATYPIPRDPKECDSEATSDCGCCPSARFVDPGL
jgi:hypothetical protein